MNSKFVLVAMVAAFSKPAFACQLCAVDMVRQGYPALYPSFVMLALWGIVYLIRKSKIQPERLNRPWRWVFHIVLIFILVGMAFQALLFFYLMILLLVQIYKDIILPTLRKQTINRGVFALHASVLFLLAVSSIWGYSRVAGMDTWERYLYNTSYGSAMGLSIAEASIHDGSFRVDRIRPILQEGEEVLIRKSFVPLSKRGELGDLTALEDDLLALPPNKYAFVSSTTFFELWLWNLGAESSDYETTAALKQWIDEQTSRTLIHE